MCIPPSRFEKNSVIGTRFDGNVMLCEGFQMRNTKDAGAALGAVVTKNPDYAAGGAPTRIISWRTIKEYDCGFKE